MYRSSARGAKRRGRPPKTVVMERPRKFQYHLLKKPKYLQNQNNDSKGSETPNSQTSTPTVSRASSPVGSESSSRRSFRSRGRGRGSRGSTRGRPSYRRGYNPDSVDFKDSDFHYGSDFGEESSGKSDHEDEFLSGSQSESPKDELSDSDFSLSSFYSSASGATRKSYSYVRNPSPVPIWLQDIEIPKLDLPESSDDLLIPKYHVMQALSIYEVLRHFRALVRLTPFRFEDFCAVLMYEDQTYLLSEIHIMLLKAILREEDGQLTHFGPQDQKDSINVSLFFIDAVTWPEVLRSYIESDKHFDPSILEILNTREYPFTDIDNRLKVLQFLTDQFLITFPVREDLIHEGNFISDEHCRVCHRLGDLVCCETCPAVYHMECVEPPLHQLPRDAWQCNLCKTHRISGVTDCLSDVEKSGLLCRQEHLGFDRHGRKYFFLARRIFVESEDGDSWYYSNKAQFEELLETLDCKEYESALCREMFDFKEEVIRQMAITEKLTNQARGNRKSYLDVVTANIAKRKKEKDEKEKLIAEGKTVASLDLEASNQMGSDHINEEVVESSEMNTGNSDSSEKNSELDDDSEVDKGDGSKGKVVTRSKTGSLGPRGFNMEDLKKKGEKLQDFGDNSRLTRLKAHQIASGTHLFKLGMENGFKTYNNHYNTNPNALSKIQKNEERDKKRFLSHKFSLTQLSEFKWAGPVHGSRLQLLSTVRQTMLQLENAIPSTLMHINWAQVRKAWVNAVASCNNAKDFARAIIVLQACIKSPVYASVWTEQLGHIKLVRTTAAEREERKKIEKREKKDKEEEEERNRLCFNFVKYTLGLKHQVWKQKGEEYRVHGQWGWQWLSYTRIYKYIDCRTVGLRAGAYKYMVQVRDERGLKIMSVDPATYKILMDKEKNKQEGNSETVTKIGAMDLNNLTVSPPISKFEEINISKALVTPGRLHYPKVAKKSKLDDFLSRRIYLKTMEEKQLSQTGGTNAKPGSVLDRDVRNLLTVIGKKVAIIKTQYAMLNKESRMYRCYGSECDQGQCYSPVCLQRVALRKELLMLLRKANIARNNATANSSTSPPLSTGKPAITAESENAENDSSKFSSGSETLRAVLEGRVVDKPFKQPSVLLKNSVIDDKKDSTKTNVKSDSSVEKSGTDNSSSNRAVQVKKEIKIENEGCDEVDVTKLEAVNEVVIKTEEASQANNDAIKTENDASQPAAEITIKTEVEDIDIKTEDVIKTEVEVKSEATGSEVVVKTEEIDGAEEPTAIKQTDTDTKAKNNIKTEGEVEEYIEVCHEVEIGTTQEKKEEVTASSVQNFTSLTGIPSKREKNDASKSSKAASVLPRPISPDPKRMYSSPSTVGKVYLKKIANGVTDKRRKRVPIKYPRGSTFLTRVGRKKSILILSQHELSRMARLAGRIYPSGFNQHSKPNPQCWQFPCSRPNFKTCWLYRTSCFKTLAAAGIQLKILWASLRWDDMHTKPPNLDGKHQITTETEIITSELLKHRHVGVFLERTEYLQRKVVIPIDLPKTVREVQSTRTGLRKRKREDNPQNTEPQVAECWIDENKMELWEIKAYGERLERANAQQALTRTRSSTGALQKAQENKANMEEMKEKMEAQLKAQRAAHQQQRKGQLQQQQAESSNSKTPQQHIIKLFPSSSSGEPYKVVTKVAIPTPTGQGKSALTTLLSTPTTANKTLTTRRIIMTKSVDGTARVVTSPANILSKTSSIQTQQTSTAQQTQATKVQQTTPSPATPGPQRVQISKGADGKLQVKGLLPGQQLVQLADGRLHVINSSNINNTVNSGTATTPTAGKQQFIIKTQGGTKTTPAKPQMVLKQLSSPIVQKVATPAGNTSVVVSGNHVLTSQLLVNTSAGSPQVLKTTSGQLISRGAGQQLVMSNPSLVQQLASGKATLATLNGQQVLIRTAVQQNVTSVKTPVIKPAPPSPSKQPPLVASQQSGTSEKDDSSVVRTETQSNTQTPPQVKSHLTPEQEAVLLEGQPPGTIIKCITAQVLQTAQGPRIVLQGLSGANFTQQQLAVIQQQVKQQLLKAQAEGGNQGVLGPTKIYLAVQPNPTSSLVKQESSEPIASPNRVSTAASQASAESASDKPAAEKVPAPKAATPPPTTPATEEQNEFVLTPDYIQQTIKSALKQDNLSPEVEQKLMKLQRYQEEKAVKVDEEEEEKEAVLAAASQLASLSQHLPPSHLKKKPDQPLSSPPPKKKIQRAPGLVDKALATSKNKLKVQEEKKKQQLQCKLLVYLYKHKEALKNDILKKRALLDNELQASIQTEVKEELASRSKVKQQQEESIKHKPVNISESGPVSRGGGRSGAGSHHPANTAASTGRSAAKRAHSNSNSKSSKKEKLLCSCRTPYDANKFYVGCDMCNNWFHGDCVGISEEMSKTLTEFVCDECKRARETQELYCLCKKPYDESQFYICCDRCQDWFHGRCVGILQSEADYIDEYICPNCQRNSGINFVNMKNLSTRDFEALKKLFKQIVSHKSAWPFIEPVDPTEAPDYYKVIKEPMDLQTIEMRINDRHYKKLSEFIGDITKIFDNCRYYNPKESPFYKCAESLESFFVNKVKGLRDKLMENK